MSDQKVCKVCDEKDGVVYQDMCDFCRHSIMRRNPAVSRDIAELERRLSSEPDCREELQELLDLRYKELRRLERMC